MLSPFPRLSCREAKGLVAPVFGGCPEHGWHAGTCMCVHMCMRMHAFVYVCLCVCMCVSVCTPVCACARVPLCAHVHVCTYVMYACTCV